MEYKIEKITYDHNKLKYFLNKQRKNVSQMACELGVSRQTVWNWGQEGIPAYKVWLIEEYLGCKIEDLM